MQEETKKKARQQVDWSPAPARAAHRAAQNGGEGTEGGADDCR